MEKKFKLKLFSWGKKRKPHSHIKGFWDSKEGLISFMFGGKKGKEHFSEILA